ncbi:hypothetical protein E4T52_17020 [Aureobasidium sp. EXF-3400]|nr:hypothetical protein E4T51_16276 [Aureobasidium sp. EXF-12344]KAI4767859.1 hypothetical protein E4T52_17020 [Aureobasidium sp. EXF-3400]
MPLQTAIVLSLETMTALSPHPIPTTSHIRHSAPVSLSYIAVYLPVSLTLSQMGLFSAHRRRTDGASDQDPSTPVKPLGQPKYTITKETPPSSSKLASRPPTPVPDCPPPPLTRQSTVNNLTAPSAASPIIQSSVSKPSFAAHEAPSPSSKVPAPTEIPVYRFPPTPPLPKEWNGTHDHAICVLDTCNYSLNAIVKKLRSAFPELSKAPLTPTMVDKRLRVLDQNPDIDYFRTGLEHANREGMEKARRGKAVSTETGPSGYDTQIPADPRVSTLTAPTSTINSSFLSSAPSLPDLPKKFTEARHQSDHSTKTTDSHTSQAGHSTRAFDTGFLSHRTPATAENDVSQG